MQEQPIDLLTLYHDFRVALPSDILQELRGKSFAAEFSTSDGWRIIRSDEDEERLAIWMQQSTVDWTTIVLDQIPGEAVIGA